MLPATRTRVAATPSTADELGKQVETCSAERATASMLHHAPSPCSLRRMSETCQHDVSNFNMTSAFSYDSHSWNSSLGIVYRLAQQSFLVYPWLILTLYTALVTVGAEVLQVVEKVDLAPDVPMGIGGTVAVLLAFRLSTCYNRWWEGRMLLGRMVTGSRSLTTRLVALEQECPDEAQRQLLRSKVQTAVGFLLAFASSLRLRLCGKRFSLTAANSAMAVAEQALLTDAEVKALEGAQNAPLCAVRWLRCTTSSIVAQMRAAGIGDVAGIDSATYLATEELLVCLAGCERIRSTPCPPGYVGVLRIGVCAFIALLPWVLLAELGYLSIGVVSISAFVLLAVEDVALQIEQPFGYDENDLPLEAIVVSLQADLLTILEA